MSTAGCLGALTPLAKGASAAPEDVLFESLGTVLVLGDDADVGDVAEIVARKHRTVVFAPGIEKRIFTANVTVVGRQVVAVQGHLGAFQAQVRSASGASDIGAASPNPNRFFDVVLDLCRQPVWISPLGPLGYFAPGHDVTARATAIDAISGLVGRFTKPKYFVYQPELCAHGASGLEGCNRCLNACSAQAITSSGNRIRVDPHLCLGCATCTLACPTGALSFRSPNREALGKRLEQALTTCKATLPVLVVHSSTMSPEVQAVISQHQSLSLVIDPLPAFGDELWLRAMALGAGALVLVNDPMLSPKSAQTIAARVAWMRALLPTLGISRERLVWLDERALPGWLDKHSAKTRDVAASADANLTTTVSNQADQQPTSPSWARYKRLAWIDDLRLLGFAHDTSLIAALPSEASFGEVRVNSQRCTLCFACTNLCPTGALKAINAATQKLVFQESACVQCGLCVRGCPEKAISMKARFAPRVLAKMTSTVLQQDEQVACTSCGSPFISRRLLASSMERLKDHPAFVKGARGALLTCSACRQRNMLIIE